MRDVLLEFSSKQDIVKTVSETNEKNIEATNILEIDGGSDKLALIAVVAQGFVVSGNGNFKIDVITSDSADFSDGQKQLYHGCGISWAQLRRTGAVIAKVILPETKKYLKVRYLIESGLTIASGKIDCYLTSGYNIKGITEDEPFDFTPLPDVVISPDGGNFSTSQSVTMSCTENSNPVGDIRYTTDGSEPTPDNPDGQWYEGEAISITQTTIINARAYDLKRAESLNITTKTFTKNDDVATPTASPDGGNFETSASIVLSCTTAGASIRYTTDGSEPTSESTEYSQEISISATTTIKAKAFKTGMPDSDVMTKTFTKTN